MDPDERNLNQKGVGIEAPGHDERESRKRVKEMNEQNGLEEEQGRHTKEQEKESKVPCEGTRGWLRDGESRRY